MLTSEHPQGVTGLVYLPQHSALIVGSHAPVAAGLDDSMSQAEQHGLSLWRILSDSPHYKLVTDYEQDLNKVSSYSPFLFYFSYLVCLDISRTNIEKLKHTYYRILKKKIFSLFI